MKLYDEARATVDPDKRRAILHKMADIAADEFEVFSVSQGLPTYGISKTNLKNTPKEIVNSWYFPTPAPALVQTFFWAN
ncbi:MAG: hypothetical protein ACK5WM_04730 [Rhodospirillales bacterium]|jgi:peptide/nickel transport system substrate-binding protein